MAHMTSHSADSERFQITLEFNRPIASVGYQNMEAGPCVALRFDNHAEKPGRGGERKAKLRERNVGLSLDEADMTRIINHIVNPSYTMGFVMNANFSRMADDPMHRLNMRIMEANGIFFERYRYPHGKDFIPVIAVNDRHAIFQISRILRHEIDASLLQRGIAEGEQTRWVDAGGWLVEKGTE